MLGVFGSDKIPRNVRIFNLITRRYTLLFRVRNILGDRPPKGCPSKPSLTPLLALECPHISTGLIP